MLTELLERLRRGDPAALEELGHQLLPFVQAVALAHELSPREPSAVLQAFRAAVTGAVGGSTGPAFATAVLEAIRAGAAGLPAGSPDPAQERAVKLLARLQPMPPLGRELVIARFVERLPGGLVCEQHRLEPAALAAIVARGVTLLVGPPTARADWLAEPALTDPDAVPPPQLVELENTLTALGIDVTALELEPLKAHLAVLPAPPALKPGYQPQAPAESYPSQVKTQQAVDLPVQAAASQATFLELAPVADETLVEVAPVVETTPRQVPALARKPQEVTAPSLAPVARAPAAEDESTALRGHAIQRAAPPVDETLVGVPGVQRSLRTWLWWPAAGLCALSSLALYATLIHKAESKIAARWTLLPVVAMTRDLSEGETVTSDAVAIRNVPAEFVSASVIQPDSIKAAIGNRVLRSLQKGDNLLWSHFDLAVGLERLAPRVAIKMRAYTIVLTEVKSVGSWLQPGEVGDLLVVFDDGDPKSPGRQSVCLVQKVQVLAVGAVTISTVAHVRRKSVNVSVLLTPEDAEAVSLAARDGVLTMSLRGLTVEGWDDEVVARAVTPGAAVLDGARLKVLAAKREGLIRAIRKQ